MVGQGKVLEVNFHSTRSGPVDMGEFSSGPFAEDALKIRENHHLDRGVLIAEARGTAEVYLGLVS